MLATSAARLPMRWRMRTPCRRSGIGAGLTPEPSGKSPLRQRYSGVSLMAASATIARTDTPSE
jgi:hypothetical protein